MDSLINLLVMVGYTVLIARLFHAGLHRTYRAFFCFLILVLLECVLLVVLGESSMAYARVWVIGQPIEWLLEAGVVLELYQLSLRDYRGLSTVGRWAVIVAFILAVAASSLNLVIPSQTTRQGRLIAFYYVAERGVNFSLVVFLITILFLLTRYPITLNRNTIVHSVVFSGYFFSNTAIFLLLSMRGSAALRTAQYGTQAVNLIAAGTWLAMLNVAGEQRRQTLRSSWMPGREEHLLNQLNRLNLALLRVSQVLPSRAV